MSTARSRQQRRKTRTSDRAPGVLRGNLQPTTETLERPVVGHGIRRGGEFSWRVVSGMIVLSLVFVLVMLFIADFFYVRSVRVAGAITLEESEVFRYADIAESHLFWIDPATVEARIIEASPLIADAQVNIGWPPNAVSIVIEERQPAVVWIQAGVTALVDVHGRVLRFPREDASELYPNLVRIYADDRNAEGPPGGNVRIASDIITGALQLQTLLAGIQELRYDRTNGLGYREAGGWDVWLGTGTDMPDKLLIYETLAANLQARGILPTEINVANAEGAYYCCQP